MHIVLSRNTFFEASKEMRQEMTGATFGSGWSGSGDNGFDVSISQDGQTFTLRFAEIEADVDKSPDLFPAQRQRPDHRPGVLPENRPGLRPATHRHERTGVA